MSDGPDAGVADGLEVFSGHQYARVCGVKEPGSLRDLASAKVVISDEWGQFVEMSVEEWADLCERLSDALAAHALGVSGRIRE
jgi:hypothetical protein